MNEATQVLTDLSPLAAVVIIAGVLASIVVQLIKRPWWSPGWTQGTLVGVSVVLGGAAYIVSGAAVGVPDSLVEAVSTGLLIIAGVAVMGRAVYSVVGHALPARRENKTGRNSGPPA